MYHDFWPGIVGYSGPPATQCDSTAIFTKKDSNITCHGASLGCLPSCCICRWRTLATPFLGICGVLKISICSGCWLLSVLKGCRWWNNQRTGWIVFNLNWGPCWVFIATIGMLSSTRACFSIWLSLSCISIFRRTEGSNNVETGSKHIPILLLPRPYCILPAAQNRHNCLKTKYNWRALWERRMCRFHCDFSSCSESTEIRHADYDVTDCTIIIFANNLMFHKNERSLEAARQLITNSLAYNMPIPFKYNYAEKWSSVRVPWLIVVILDIINLLSQVNGLGLLQWYISPTCFPPQRVHLRSSSIYTQNVAGTLQYNPRARRDIQGWYIAADLQVPGVYFPGGAIMGLRLEIILFVLRTRNPVDTNLLCFSHRHESPPQHTLKHRRGLVHTLIDWAEVKHALWWII